MNSQRVTFVLGIMCVIAAMILTAIISIGENTEAHSVSGSELTELRDSITIDEYQKGLPDSIASHNADSIYLDKVRTYTYD